MKNLSKKVLTLALASLPFLGFAQFGPSLNAPTTNVTSLSDVSNLIVTIINWLTGIFFAVAVLFIFYSAYLYLTAAGDEEKLGKAKNQLIYSIIAIVVALLAGSIRFIVQSLL